MMYNWLTPGSIVASIVIFVELSIFLAFYKDVIFASITFANYFGMIIVTWNQVMIERKVADNDMATTNALSYSLITVINFFIESFKEIFNPQKV